MVYIPAVALYSPVVLNARGDDVDGLKIMDDPESIYHVLLVTPRSVCSADSLAAAVTGAEGISEVPTGT